MQRNVRTDVIDPNHVGMAMTFTCHLISSTWGKRDVRKSGAALCVRLNWWFRNEQKYLACQREKELHYMWWEYIGRTRADQEWGKGYEHRDARIHLMVPGFPSWLLGRRHPSRPFRQPMFEQTSTALGTIVPSSRTHRWGSSRWAREWPGSLSATRGAIGIRFRPHCDRKEQSTGLRYRLGNL